MIALIGRNGAGKSTLSKLICGIVRPDKGRILCDGEDTAPLSIKEGHPFLLPEAQGGNRPLNKLVQAADLQRPLHPGTDLLLRHPFERKERRK